MIIDASLLNTQHCKVRIKNKEEQSRDGVAPFPTLWCSNYWKGSLRVTLDCGRQIDIRDLVSCTLGWIIVICICFGLAGRKFTDGPENRDSIPGWVIPKTKNMFLDTTLLKTQHYKVCSFEVEFDIGLMSSVRLMVRNTGVQSQIESD